MREQRNDLIRPRILIVEDEEIVSIDLRRGLTELGYEVVGSADNGIKAIRLTEELEPDLVLMDIKLRGEIDGIAAAAEIHRQWQVPVVFLTANANDDILARARVTGAYGYLVKPFRAQELNGTLLLALSQHHALRELFAEHTWMRTLLDNLSDGVIATDAGGCIRYLNPVAEEMTGWYLREAVGRAIEEVYPLASPSGEAVEQCQLRKALAQQATVGKQRFLLRSRNGRSLVIEDAAATILSGGQVMGSVNVFVDITERARQEREKEEERDWLEQQVQETNEALGHTRAELRALSGHLLTAQEEERRRIARELHDDFAQRTAVAEMELDYLARFIVPGAGEKALNVLRTRLDELSTALRDVSHRLHPSTLADLGLVTAISQLITDFRQAGGSVSLTNRNVPELLPLNVSTALYRITQEALRNVTRHAPDAPVRITLSGRNDEVHLTVEDAGPGFDLGAVRNKGGLGLLSMQERARLVGGSLLLRTQPGGGTLIFVRVPVSAESVKVPSIPKIPGET